MFVSKVIFIKIINCSNIKNNNKKKEKVKQYVSYLYGGKKNKIKELGNSGASREKK